MARAIVNAQPTRVLLVAVGSAAAFIGLAILIFWQYFTWQNGQDRAILTPQRRDEGLAVLHLVIYSAMLLHVIGGYGVAAALSRWMRFPVRPTLAYVTVLFVVLAVPVYGFVSAIHMCTTGDSLPFPGQPPCD